MANESDIEKIFEKEIASFLEMRNIYASKPDVDAIAHEALLASKAFIRVRPPTITVTGITSTGKSTLINALFGEKKVKEGLTADTTDKIITIRFKSGLLIYDTPGAGGEERLENITRAYLGLKQLEKDLDGNELQPVELIPTINADTYNEAIDEPKFSKRYEDFEKPDLFIFVVNIRAGALKRDDTSFFREVVKIGKPVIVVINQIDSIEEKRIQAGIDLVKKKLDRQAIAISAKERQNIQEVAVTIGKSLPIECGEALRETINEQYRKLLRHQQVRLYSIAAAVKTAQIVGVQGNTENALQIVSYVLALYTGIVSKYTLSDKQLRNAGISFTHSLESLEDKMTEARNVNSGVRLLILVGSATGATLAAIATAGAALPIALGVIGAGTIGGSSLGAIVGFFNGIIKRKRILNVEDEAQDLKQYISTVSRFETAVTVLTFGKALNECCSKLEEQHELGQMSKVFKDIFDEEYVRTTEELKPFSEKINHKRLDNEERLIKEIYSDTISSV